MYKIGQSNLFALCTLVLTKNLKRYNSKGSSATHFAFAITSTLQALNESLVEFLHDTIVRFVPAQRLWKAQLMLFYSLISLAKQSPVSLQEFAINKVAVPMLLVKAELVYLRRQRVINKEETDYCHPTLNKTKSERARFGTLFETTSSSVFRIAPRKIMYEYAGKIQIAEDVSCSVHLKVVKLNVGRCSKAN